jgi:hypothetical protein
MTISDSNPPPRLVTTGSRSIPARLWNRQTTLSGLFGVTMEQTATGANLLTPEYASPEQIRGDKITTASDVYALGVLLYELLSGRHPFRFKTGLAGEVLQVISERQPPAPSTAALTQEEIAAPEDATRSILSPDTVAEMRSEKPARLQRKLAGDLDNIVLMALRKEPERRYSSVLQFAEDVRRHLDGLPVAARPATFSYRASKFIERNRTATAFATIALAAILIGLSIAVWQAIVARQQSARAERRSAEIRRLTNTLGNQIGVLPGSDPAQEKLYKVSIEYLNGLAKETRDPAVLKQLSEAYVLLGKRYGYANGKPEEVRANILRGLEISRRLVAATPKDMEAKRLLAMNLVEYDFFCEKEPAEKLKLNQERTRLWEELVAAAPDDGDDRAELASSYSTLAYLLNLYERPDEAANYSRLVQHTREREIELLDKNPATNHERDLFSLAYMNLGSTYADEFKDLQTAEDYYKRALTVAEALVAEHPDYRMGWVRLAAANHEIADVRHSQGDYQAALDHFRTCLRVVTDESAKLNDGNLRGAEPFNMPRVAGTLHLTGHPEEALQMMRDAAAVNDQMNDFGGTAASIATRDAKFLSSTGDVYAVFGQRDKALASYREAESLWKKVAAIEPQQQVNADAQIARLCLLQGNVYAATPRGQPEARNQYQEYVEILSKLKATNEIALRGLKDLREAQQKLQALAS